MNKKNRIISVPNYAVMLFVWTVIYILLLSLGDEPLDPMILLFGLSFVGYMASLFQVVVIRSNRSISSFYPFRLKRVTITFEDISKVSFETDDYRLGNGGLRIDSRCLKTAIKSASGSEIKFSDSGFENFHRLVKALPLSTVSIREFDDACCAQAKHNFLRSGDIACGFIQVLMMLFAYSLTNRNVALFIGLGIFLIVRMVVQQVGYARERISASGIASQRIERGVVRISIIAAIVMALTLLKTVL